MLWHPAAGVIDAQTTVHAMLAAAAGHGAQLVTHWPVHGIERTGSGYRVTAPDGRSLDAERVVVAAGGWLPDLLDRLPLPDAFRAALPALQVSQENAYHFPYRDQPDGWPTFIHKDSAIQTYGLPGGRDADFRGQKLAEFNGGRKISSAAADRTGSIDPANRPGSSTTSSSTCPAWCPSRTPTPRACSPTPPPRTSSSTASTGSPWSPRARATAPSSPR